MKNSNKERNYHALTHASAPLLGLIGGMTFLGPLVMWLAFKGEYPSIEDHAKKALNFHITMLILTIVSVILFGVLLFSFLAVAESGAVTYSIESVEVMDQVGDVATSSDEAPFWPVALLVGGIGWIISLALLQFIAPIVMTFKAYNGRFNKYPFAFPFFKL